MPIKIPRDLPAFKVLSDENIFVMNNERAGKQDIRPLKIAILNLMPKKIQTENQLLRYLSNTPLQVEIKLLQTESYRSTHTSLEHMEKFYSFFNDIIALNIADFYSIFTKFLPKIDFYEKISPL